MKGAVSKRVFDVGVEGFSGLVEYTKGLPSGGAPITCPYAKSLEEEVFVMWKSSVDKYELGMVVCPVRAESSGGQDIGCQNLSNTLLTEEQNVRGYCGAVKKWFHIKVKRDRYQFLG